MRTAGVGHDLTDESIDRGAGTSSGRRYRRGPRTGGTEEGRLITRQTTIMRPVSNPAVEPSTLPPADEAAVRAHREALRALAAQHGIGELRFASPGRLVGHVAEDKDALDTADFEIAARALLGAEIGLFSDRVLSEQHVSPDLIAAQPV